MNQQFKCELNGKELFKKIVLYLIAVIVSYVAFMVVLTMAEESNSPINYISAVVLYFLLLLSAIALQFHFIASLIPAVSLDDKSFSFSGTLSQYMKIYIKGIFLTLLTFGIYSPWFYTELTNFLADNTKSDDKELVFMGNAPKLLKYMILGFFLPILALVGIMLPQIMKLSIGNYENIATVFSIVVLFFVYFVGVFIISAVITVLQYKWIMDFNFGQENLTLDLNLPRAVGYILGQLALTMITWGIYGFAAEVTIFRYFTNRVVLTNINDNSIRRMKFNGDTGTGFGLIFAQTVLTIITVGIYAPWAYANIKNWFISNVEIVDEASENKDLYLD